MFGRLGRSVYELARAVGGWWKAIESPLVLATDSTAAMLAEAAVELAEPTVNRIKCSSVVSSEMLCSVSGGSAFSPFGIVALSSVVVTISQYFVVPSLFPFRSS